LYLFDLHSRKSKIVVFFDDLAHVFGLICSFTRKIEIIKMTTRDFNTIVAHIITGSHYWRPKSMQFYQAADLKIDNSILLVLGLGKIS